MEKEALLNVIINGLKEVELMVESFKGKEQVIPAFMKLTLQKVDNIRQELELLDQLNVIPVVESTPVDNLKKKKSVVTPQPIVEEIKIETPKSIVPPAAVFEEEIKLSPEVVVDEVVEQKSSVLPKQAEKETEMEWIAEEAPIQSPISITEKPVIDHVEAVASPVKENVLSPVIEATPVKPIVSPQDIKFKEEIIDIHVDAKHKHTTLGETLGGDRTPLIDRFAGLKSSSESFLAGKPVDDIRKAIGINDRFLFVRELFNGNSSLMNQTIDQLNEFKSFDDACMFLSTNFNWSHDNEALPAFMSTVKRKFI